MFLRLLICGSVLFIALGSAAAYGQRLAIIVPEHNETSERYAESLRGFLVGAGARVFDLGASDAPFRTSGTETPFNMSAAQARTVGEALGADFYVLVKGQSQKRTSLETRGYIESSAAVFVVSSRTGRLIHWEAAASESPDSEEADAGLLRSAGKLAGTIVKAVETAYRTEMEPDRGSARFPELPDEGSPEARGLKPPVPYKRIKPAYTNQAYLYDVRATVDIEVSIDEAGKIAATDIIRWAGYGLDESVTNAVRSMNWRPAERNGKPLPMRILLRYNFTKIEKEAR